MFHVFTVAHLETRFLETRLYLFGCVFHCYIEGFCIFIMKKDKISTCLAKVLGMLPYSALNKLLIGF